ncbi:MAG: DUF4202 domain-containing protein [Verrucomicrobiota bacterium]|jgi:hypothetical protein
MNAFQRAIEAIDAENARDPNLEPCCETNQPRELLYAQRLTGWLLKLAPDASETLRLAARCQHICRWTIPRDSYPMTKAGYLRWRNDLKNFHARKTGEVLAQAGCAADVIQRVQDLNLKKNFPGDPESRLLEDALCLVFLEFQLADLAAKTAEAKMINAIQKTWQKMTPTARQHALALPLGAKETQLIDRAFAP